MTRGGRRGAGDSLSVRPPPGGRHSPLCAQVPTAGGSLRLRITLAQPHDEVTELVRLAAYGIVLDDASVWVKNSTRAFAGRAYCSGRHCVVRIGRPTHFPIRNHHYPRLKTAPAYDIETWQEALVVVTAHELRHQEQYRLGRPASEIDAERWALQRLDAYRASNALADVP